MDHAPRLPRLGRPSKDVDDDGTAQAGLARAVRYWREEHPPYGHPSQSMIAKGAGVKIGAVKKQLYGVAFLDRDVVMYIARTKASASQIAEWEALYSNYAAAHRSEQRGEESARPGSPSWQTAPEVEPAPHDPAATEGENQQAHGESSAMPLMPGCAKPSAPAHWLVRPRALLALALIIFLFGGATGWTLAKATAPTPETFSGPQRFITVQNKVALGASNLTEDKTPAYLSTVPRPYCADEINHCEVPGSQMQSGAAIEVDCVTTTDIPMYNYDTKDPDALANADAARSRLWYHGRRDGMSGFISEVYIVARDRNGLGLPSCPSQN